MRPSEPHTGRKCSGRQPQAALQAAASARWPSRRPSGRELQARDAGGGQRPAPGGAPRRRGGARVSSPPPRAPVAQGSARWLPPGVLGERPSKANPPQLRPRGEACVRAGGFVTGDGFAGSEEVLGRTGHRALPRGSARASGPGLAACQRPRTHTWSPLPAQRHLGVARAPASPRGDGGLTQATLRQLSGASCPGSPTQLPQSLLCGLAATSRKFRGEGPSLGSQDHLGFPQINTRRAVPLVSQDRGARGRCSATFHVSS